MTNTQIDPKILEYLRMAQRNEITEYHIYNSLAKTVKDAHNRGVIENIAKDEARHYQQWRQITGEDIQPDKLAVSWHIFVSRVFGLAFGLKLMEKGETLAQKAYKNLEGEFSQTAGIIADEQKHEDELLSILKEERVEYAGSIVLGLNDALVELTGALAGLTLALGNGKIIAITGLITGCAASMSMAASNYLSIKEEAGQNDDKKPLKSAVYTGITYLVTVALLVFPYFIFSNVYKSLGVMLCTSIAIIFGYTFYITTAKSLKFWGRFLEMAVISLSVAFISFGIGWVIKTVVGVDI